MRVFMLLPDYDPEYQGLQIEVGDRLEFHRRFCGSPMKAPWTEVTFRWRPETRQCPKGDLPDFVLGLKVFSWRAMNALADLLEGNGEILPITCEEEQLFIFNVTRVIEALDESGSEVMRFDDGIRFMSITRYAFFPEKLMGAVIFKIPQSSSEVFVTDPFVERAKRAGLKGLWFHLLWSSDPEEMEALKPKRYEESEIDAAEVAVELTEEPLDDETRTELDDCIAHGLERLGLTGEEDPLDIVTGVANHVAAWHDAGQRSPTDDPELLVLSMAALWAQQVCRAYGWEWVSLQIKGRTRQAIVSLDRSFAGYPFRFIKKFTDDPRLQSTIILTFNMLDPEVLRGDFPHCRPGSYKTLV